MSPTAVVLVAVFGLALGAKLPDRIVGGEDATIEEYPYQLSLRYIQRHMCGASIIAPNYALTAAHCVYNIASNSAITLHANTSRRSDRGSMHWIRKINVHPQFDIKTVDYDFAVLEVSTPFPDGIPGAAIIPLASSEPSANDIAVVSGWGKLSTNGSPPEQLQVVSIPMIDRNVCASKWAAYSFSQRMMCAGTADGSKDSCVGDSGGPLVCNGKQCGIVSWGLACADTDHPGVYSNIANQLDWIKSVAKL